MGEGAGKFHWALAPVQRGGLDSRNLEGGGAHSSPLYTGNKNTYLPLSGGILRTKVLKHFVNGT